MFCTTSYVVTKPNPISYNLGEHHHVPIDIKCLQVLIQLRRMGHLKKDDFQRYELVYILCSQQYFAESRLRFLVEWDPTSLTPLNNYGYLPLHHAAYHSSIRGFRMVFEYGIRYFPKKKGISLLFKIDDIVGHTPFQEACNKFGYKQVMACVENTLARYSDTPTPINVVDALIMAAINENIHLDCVYFLTRRQPNVLLKLSQSSQSSSAALSAFSNENKNNISNGGSSSSSSSSSSRRGSNSDNSDNSVMNEGLIVKDNPKKRKLEEIEKEKEDHT
jgi:hypothetical protein